MSRERRPVSPVTIVRLMALVCVVLAGMCLTLAFAWSHEREKAACWRVAAQYQLQGEGGCDL